MRPPRPAVARQLQAAAAAKAAAAKAAAKEAIKKEDAKKPGLRQLAETKIIDCKEKSMSFLEVLGQLKQSGLSFVNVDTDVRWCVRDEMGIEWWVWENGYYKQRTRL